MIRLTRAAEKDLKTIRKSSIESCGKEQTDKYFQTLKNCLELLSANPFLGKDISEIRENYFKFPHESHVIYYKIEASYILIVRVLHKYMDVKKHI